VFLTQQASASLKQRNKSITTFLRVAEPFAVFFIMAGLMRSAAEFGGASINANLPIDANLVDAIFAGVIVASLFWSNSISWRKLSEIASKRNADDVSQKNVVTVSTVLSDLKKLYPAFGFISLLSITIFFSLLVAYLTPGDVGHNHLVEGTGYIAAVCLFFTVIILYWPSPRLDSWETDTSSNFDEIYTATPRQFFNRLGGVFLALCALNVYTIFLFKLNFQTEALLFWSGYLVLTWALFDMRRWRFSVSDLGGEAGRANDADYAELLTAFGLISSFVAIISQYVEKSLN
jgi:hypothetical protein